MGSAPLAITSLSALMRWARSHRSHACAFSAGSIPIQANVTTPSRSVRARAAPSVARRWGISASIDRTVPFRRASIAHPLIGQSPCCPSDSTTLGRTDSTRSSLLGVERAIGARCLKAMAPCWLSDAMAYARASRWAKSMSCGSPCTCGRSRTGWTSQGRS
jgi:hypothetical protein